ncbi:hypothetical protein QEN19_004162 [Hanseniaspora menglaensis]
MFSLASKPATLNTTANTPSMQFGATAAAAGLNNTSGLTGFGSNQQQTSTNASNTTIGSSNSVIISQPTSYSIQIADSLTSLQQQILPISPNTKFQQILFNVKEQFSNIMMERPITKNIEEWELILKKTPENMIPVALNNLEDEYSRLKLQQTTIIAFRTTINKLYYELYLPTNEKMIMMKSKIENMILKIDKLQTKLYKIEMKLRYLITSSNQQENQQHTANSLAIDMKIEQLNNTIQEGSNKLISGDCWNKLSLLKKKHEQLQKITKNIVDEGVTDGDESSRGIDDSVLKILKLQQDGIVYLDKVISKDLQENF